MSDARVTAEEPQKGTTVTTDVTDARHAAPAGPPPTKKRQGGRRIWAWAAVVLVLAGAVFAGYVLLNRDTGDSASAATDLPPATDTIKKQTLSDTQTEEGQLAYGSSREVNARAAGTVTALTSVGTTVTRGKTLYRLDNKRVVLLYGKLPAYRTLSDGVEGSDVRQFERNLRALGYDGFTVDDEYTDATADAVEEWQDDLGWSETGRVTQDQIVYAAGAVRIDAHTASVGDAVQQGGQLLTFTGSDRVVTVELDVDDQRLAKKGDAVTMTLPDNSTTKGHISEVESVVESTTSNGQSSSETKIEVTVTADDDKKFASWDSASVDVAFTASKRENVLTVPVTALLALSEGGYGIQVIDGTTSRIVAVKTGLFANSRLEISGDGISEGMTVGLAK